MSDTQPSTPLPIASKCSKCGGPFVFGEAIQGHETATWHTTCPSTPLPDNQGVTPPHLQNLGNPVSTPLDDEVEQILIKLIDQVTLGDGEPLTATEVFYKAMAIDLLSKAYAKQFLELPQMQDEDAYADVITANAIIRNELRAKLRAAVNKMVGAQDE